ncbi:HTH-type transcriptional regulator PuuR [Roseobacter fucihabitans]|uniref:HTH-type transcriptional regulator PuuR n=1 Tax=Roseobacter fucihabitans TaxID=1537242 RepID=A0ABZ2C006_9RHOB|nr:cupin domain-containing protein [Roseobacter litoralis]MBC6965164.1 HTH-type transcriptional regulator PuuR [Roseobacter litoralis]MBC6965833.1 HTH-type transcriptional regulator PuuR [Roseobacter litoralis]
MDIGKRLRTIRKKRGLSQRELAMRAGLTNGTISLIEQNKTSPSVASLKSLLDAIQVSMAEFFSTLEEPPRSKYFYIASEFTEIAPPEQSSGIAPLLSLRQLGNAQDHALQLLHEHYAPGADTGPELLSHEAEEAGIVIRGHIEITVDDEVEVLGPGDGYLFNSRLPHRFRNTGDVECEVISACTPPSF